MRTYFYDQPVARKTYKSRYVSDIERLKKAKDAEIYNLKLDIMVLKTMIEGRDEKIRKLKNKVKYLVALNNDDPNKIPITLTEEDL